MVLYLVPFQRCPEHFVLILQIQVVILGWGPAKNVLNLPTPATPQDGPLVVEWGPAALSTMVYLLLAAGSSMSLATLEAPFSRRGKRIFVTENFKFPGIPLQSRTPASPMNLSNEPERCQTVRFLAGAGGC